MKEAVYCIRSAALSHQGQQSIQPFTAAYLPAVKVVATVIATILAFLCTVFLPSQSFASQQPDPELKQRLLSAVNTHHGFKDRFDADVWLTDMSGRLKRYIKDDETRMKLLINIHKEASIADLNPQLVIAVIHVESGFDRFALSRVGAQGYMQVMPFWKKELGRTNDNLMNEATNLRYGCTILKYYIDKEKGDWQRGLARYNGSLGRTKYPEKVFKFMDKYWQVN
ncbi:lytic transglycosylase domain-containing protein [Litoribrevibacter euphylliae]|uniref:Lytic transglycosylase domain-containing protein n=1 Tax=Litoribrevibacter euphylliae TaxID=1834034 RepID=A0ABV7H9D8_9GAMM